MGKKIVVGLGALCAIVEGVAPGVVPGNLLPMALVLLGLAWGWLGVDAENPTMYCALAVAVGMAGYSDALGNLAVIGTYLDGIIDNLSILLYSGVATLAATRTVARLTEA